MPQLTVTGTNIDAPDANALADFYRRLLGWTTVTEEPGWVILRSPGGGHSLNFQTEERYVRPVWPAGPGDQQMMMHLEIRVDDLEAAVAHAVAQGAALPGSSPRKTCGPASTRPGIPSACGRVRPGQIVPPAAALRGDLGSGNPYSYMPRTGFPERGSCMSKHGSARVVLAAAALIVLAGCSGAGRHTAPDVPGETTGSTPAGATSMPSSAAPVSTARPSATSKPFVKANSIPFPVAVGNTWVYRTTAGGATGRTTNTIVAAGPGTAGYRVTMSSTTDVAGAAATVQPVYVFYPDGTIGYPVPPVNGLSARPAAGGIRWPDAAGLASGRAYHSVLRVLVSQAAQDADVTVHGAGTVSVTVPAGTYQASVVETTIAAKGMTVEVTNWIAQGVGPVKTEVLIKAAGEAGLTTTSELLSFTRATSAVGDGS